PQSPGPAQAPVGAAGQRGGDRASVGLTAASLRLAPTPALPRKRRREQSGCVTFSPLPRKRRWAEIECDTFFPHFGMRKEGSSRLRHVLPPPPLAGEGRGGGHRSRSFQPQAASPHPLNVRRHPFGILPRCDSPAALPPLPCCCSCRSAPRMQ